MICFGGESSSCEFFSIMVRQQAVTLWLWVPPRLKVFLVLGFCPWRDAIKVSQPLLGLLPHSTIPGANYTLALFVFSINVSFKPIKMGRNFK